MPRHESAPHQYEPDDLVTANQNIFPWEVLEGLPEGYIANGTPGVIIRDNDAEVVDVRFYPLDGEKESDITPTPRGSISPW